MTVERASAQLATISPGSSRPRCPRITTRRVKIDTRSSGSGLSPARRGGPHSGRTTPRPSRSCSRCRPRRAHRLRQPGQLDARPLGGAGARDRRAPGARRLRGRLIRQLLAESLILAAAGAACGGALAQALTRALVSALNTESSPLFVNLHPDWRVLAFTVALTGLTCVLFGLAPAFHATRSEPAEALKTGGRGIAGSLARSGIRRALVVSQISLSLVLLVGALLFVRTFRNLSRVDAGFRQDRVLVSAMDFSALQLPKEARTEFKRRLLERVRAIPGVVSAASARLAPVSGDSWNEEVFVAGAPAPDHNANFNTVSPGYFQTLRMRFLAGRDFDDTDRKGTPRVAVVTKAFARRFFSGSNPVGGTSRRRATGAASISSTGSSASFRTPSTTTCGKTSRRSSLRPRPRTIRLAPGLGSSSSARDRPPRSCRRSHGP